MSKGSLVSPETRSGIRARIEPLALAMARAGLTPNMLTLIGFAIASAGGVLAAFELWLLAGVVATVGSAFDMFDGAVARLTGTTSKLGAFLDSTFDRWGEAIVYLGIVIGASRAGVEWDVWLATAAMGAAFMVSYARAKSEGLGFTEGTGMAAVGVMPREVRLVVLSLGLIVSGIASDLLTLAIALAIIAIGATITVIQRILHVRSQARAAGNSAREGRPARQFRLGSTASARLALAVTSESK